MQHGLPPVISVVGGGDGTRLARSTRTHWPRRPWRAGRRCGNHPDNHAGHRDRPRSRETRRRCARITVTGGDTSLGAEADVIQRSWRPRWPTRPMSVSRQKIIDDPRSDQVHLSLCSWTRRPKFEITQLPRLCCPAGCDRFCIDPPRSPRGLHFFGGIGHCWLRSHPQPLSPPRTEALGGESHPLLCGRPPHVAPHHRQRASIRLWPAVAPLKWLSGHVWGGVDPSTFTVSARPLVCTRLGSSAAVDADPRECPSRFPLCSPPLCVASFCPTSADPWCWQCLAPAQPPARLPPVARRTDPRPLAVLVLALLCPPLVFFFCGPR